MDLKAAVEAAKKKGMRLPKVDEPFVKPAKSSRDWQNHPDGGGRLGMNAARAAEGTSNKVHSHYIVKAASLASIGLMALSLLVLDATVKFHVVSYQIETGNGFRSYALLSGASLLRALAGVSLLRDGYDACEALCRMFWYMFKGMDEVERSPGMQPISKGKALQIVFSVTLRFAETIFAGNDDAMSVVVTIRNVLGVTALCGFAARNCSFHSCEVAIRVRNSNVPRRRDRFDGVVRARSLDHTGPASARGFLEFDGQGHIEGRRRFCLWRLVEPAPGRRRLDARPLAVRLVPENRRSGDRRHGLRRLATGDHDVRHGAARHVAGPAVPDLL